MWTWNSREADKPEGFSPEAAHIGKSIMIQGEVSGSEDVYVAGEVQGSLELLKPAARALNENWKQWPARNRSRSSADSSARQESSS